MKLQFFSKIFFVIFFSLSSYSNEAMDNKVKKLTLELRCMTCQNQSVYDSDSDYSKDIKIFVKKKFEEGLTEKEIKKILTERYGEYILFKPYFNSKNLFLWLFPFILLILSMIILLKSSKKTKSK
ncbi:cytochrome c-type biogenesis protein CcmH [Alphaproteobacteria bacterium]|nr:cytochrome c-type biogenesis protein CcmH [Alphaproteobacteria bacterium]